MAQQPQAQAAQQPQPAAPPQASPGAQASLPSPGDQASPLAQVPVVRDVERPLGDTLAPAL